MNIEPKINPWAAPGVEKTQAESNDSHLLPVEFRTPLLTRLFMLPIGVLMTMVTMSTCYVAVGFLNRESLSLAFALLAIAFLVGGAAWGCLVPMRCKILATENEIQKTELFREDIKYSEIRSWHHHPVTRTVYVLLSGDTDYVAISNWAMSREKSEILGKILREKIGPSRG